MKIVPEISLRHDLQYFLFISTPTIDIEPKQESPETVGPVRGFPVKKRREVHQMKKRNDHNHEVTTDTFRRVRTDPQGSYTGVPEEPGEAPVQDADDL